MINPLSFIKSFKKRASDLAVRNVLYNWSLGGNTSSAFVTTPPDLWGGDREKGHKLCEDIITLHGERSHFYTHIWDDMPQSDVWYDYLQSFEWLHDLKAMGGDMPRLKARQMIESWLKAHYICEPLSWRGDLCGRRLVNCAKFFDFFGASASDTFQDAFFDSYTRQARHVSRSINNDLIGLRAYDAIHGLVVAGLALKGREPWLELALDRLQDENSKQILADGGHISRNPQTLLSILKTHIEIRAALGAAGYPVPAPMMHMIDRMAQALRFFRFADRKFCLFHGAQEGDIDKIDTILSKANARGKVLSKLPQSGYERLSKGRSVVMMDCAAPPKWPYDDRAHASPLAFEFCYGKERIFVSCGTHPLDKDWQDALRATAAHNSLDIDYRNAGEIKEDGHFGRRPQKISLNREENQDAVLVEASHDGYTQLNGITHRRRLYLGNQGHDFRGEDKLTCPIGLGRPVIVNIRFHLHPKVQVSLIRDGAEALLRLPGSAGFRFQAGNGILKLENSIYMGEGTQPRKTKQIVISGTIEKDRATIKWAMQREGVK